MLTDALPSSVPGQANANWRLSNLKPSPNSGLRHLWRLAFESDVGSVARRSALRKNRRLSRPERNCFQITARVFSVTQRRHALRVSIELAINQLANKTRQPRKQLAVKVRIILPRIGQAVFAAAISVSLLIALNVSAQAILPVAAASPPPAQVTTGATAEVERVIVTGSNIPTAAETGPNPVDTYRPADIERLGIRNATDLTTFLPQQAGGTTNLNMGTGGDGTVQFNLRGLLAKETLVLVDGKRVAFGSSNVVGFSGGVDINLLPFPMIDHIDILKDGASAVYGSDAIAGVVNFFLVHKFRGLEIGGSYGNTNLGASNDMGEWEAWIKAGTGDDKTEIVVIADFWERTGGVFSRDRDLSANAFYIPWGGGDGRTPINLVSFLFLSSAAGYYRACFSALAVHRYPA